MPEAVTNQLSAIRRARGMSAAELAERAEVSRQTIYAIESGAYVPNTAVALRLACVLEVSVEEIFRLPANPVPQGSKMTSQLLSASPARAGIPVRICRVGNHQVAVPAAAAPYFLQDADGVLTQVRHGSVSELLTPVDATARRERVVVAGCDPAIGILAAQMAREGGAELVAAGASSRLALRWLKEGKVHVAGTHLRDPESGEFNLPFLRREFAGEDLAVVTFAHWEEGFVTAPLNPHSIRTVEDLRKRGIRIVNREPGSGSRALLDRLLRDSHVSPKKIAGYQHLAAGHLAAAYSVLIGEADCCIATHSAALAFGLGFVPLQRERFDFVLRREILQLPAVRVLLDTLQRASLRRRLEMWAGCETQNTGARLG